MGGVCVCVCVCVCVIIKQRRTCKILEVADPFDPFVQTCYQTMFDKYLPLCQRIQELVFHCRIRVFIIGSLGSVHDKFVSGL